MSAESELTTHESPEDHAVKAWTPTRRQRMVLRLLANRGPMSAADVAYQHLGIPASTARSIFYALGQRSLVDVAGFGRDNARTFGLTCKGVAFERDLLSGDEDEPDGGCEWGPWPACGRELVGEYSSCPYCHADLRTDYEREADDDDA